MAYIGKSPTAAPLTSSDVADGIISTAKIADTAITNAKLNADIISGDTALGAEPADTDELLVSDAGVLKRMDYSHIKGGAGLVKLASTTISSAVAAVAFDNNYITSTYDNYKLICYGLSTASDNQDIGVRMSVDNGSNFATHVGSFNYTHLNTGTANSTGASGNYGLIPIGGDEASGPSQSDSSCEFTFYNVNGTAQYTFVSGWATAINQSGPNYYGYRIHGYIASTTAVNYLKVFTNEGGNLDAGTCTLYGITK